MPIRRQNQPAPVPVVTSDGYQIASPTSMTLQHPRARVAKDPGFWCNFTELPAGRITPARRWARPGSVVDADSPTARRFPHRFRKPTRAER